MRGLINPMLSYYWVNAWRELGLNAGNPSLNATTPAEIAVRAATHENQDLCSLWFMMTSSLAEANPGRAEPLIWEGIVISSLAGAKGGLSALGLVKQARVRYEAAMKIDDKALDGSAYNSLGVLSLIFWSLNFIVSFKYITMILRADTAVTNHGFRDGQATELHSVLQAGTAVLVDDQGQPVARRLELLERAAVVEPIPLR